MSKPSDEPDEPAPRKPIQYSIRSLFVITTLVALWLSSAKMFPNMEVAILAAPVIALPLVPYLFIARWLIRRGSRRIGIACVVNGLLLVIPPLALSTVLEVRGVESNYPRENSLICLFMGVAVVTAPGWFFVMAGREKQLQHAEEARRLAEQPKSQ
jgi:hypothetical protein